MAPFRDIKTCRNSPLCMPRSLNHFNHQRYLNRRDIFNTEPPL